MAPRNKAAAQAAAQREREQRERQQREREQRERQQRERQAQQQRERQAQQQRERQAQQQRERQAQQQRERQQRERQAQQQSQRQNQGNVKKVIRQAGENISRSEMKQITKAAGGDVKKAINRIASVQEKMKQKGGVAPNLASGAANMLIKQAEKAPAGRLGMLPSVDFGTSKLGQTLQSMVGSPGIPTRGGGTLGAVTPFNPGGSPNKPRMIGGTVIRPGGNIAVRPMAAPAAAAPAAPAPTISEPTGGEDGGGDGFDMQSILDALGAFQMPEMPDFSGMFDGMFDQLSSAFDTPDPIQLAALGQAYGGDMIRARQRQRKSRRDYRRGITGASMANAFTPLMIGGGLTL